MRYFKMNGCGNDFVIFDARAHGALQLTPAQARAVADRGAGVGCDQVIALERSVRGDVFMRIWNSDGAEVSACGNGARCVGFLLLEEAIGGRDAVRIETAAGLLEARAGKDGAISVDMGSPLLKWEEIPVARKTDTVEMDYSAPGDDTGWLVRPGGVNMGNPHAVFFVADVAEIDIPAIGPRVERDSFFPEGVNVGFAEIRAPDRIRLRVWERGAGLTKACGTGACAAAVAAHRAGLTLRSVTMELDGGDLLIDWRASDDRVIMTGPVALERFGELEA
jgi:diaminopimelate epimerase